MPAKLGTQPRFTCKGLKDGELLIIATNSEKPFEALQVYKQRWFIECLFGDSKTRGLNVEDTGMANLAKLTLLVAIITLTTVW